MKIAILQCNVKNGEILANSMHVKEMAQNNADLSIVPLAAFTGPFPAMHHEICEKLIARALKTLAEDSLPPILTGSRYFGYYLVENGLCMRVPNLFFFKGQKFSIFYEHYNDQSPNDSIAVNLDCHEFITSYPAHYEKKMAALAKANLCALSANIVGGYENHVFSGESCACFPDGSIFHASAFQEEVYIIDIDNPYECENYPIPDLNSRQWQALVLGVRDFIHKNGASDALIGISGGMDSALVACIAVDALQAEHVCGVLMPSRYTSSESTQDAEALVANLGIKTFNIPIESMYAAFTGILNPVLSTFPDRNNDTTLENLQARIRAVILMTFANKSGSLVLNTGNKSEAAMGYSTLYGDSVGALGVIGDIFKTRVYELAKWYCKQKGRMIIPENIFVKAPSAELRPGQKDTDSLPPYDILDPQLEAILANPGADKNLSELEAKVRFNRFKRAQSPPALLVGYGDDLLMR